MKYINVQIIYIYKYENIGKSLFCILIHTQTKNIDMSNAKKKPIISYNKLNTPAHINPSWKSIYGGSGDGSVGKALAWHT